MAISQRLQKYLDDNNVKYVVVSHSRAYTAQEIAARVHVKGSQLAKSVVVKGNGKDYMVVLAASHKINFDKLKEFLGLKDLRLANEQEFKDLFADCEVGAMPPFGNLYELPVIVDEELYKDVEIAFNGGNHVDVVKMTFADFERLVKPQKASFGEHV